MEHFPRQDDGFNAPTSCEDGSCRSFALTTIWPLPIAETSYFALQRFPLLKSFRQLILLLPESAVTYLWCSLPAAESLWSTKFSCCSQFSAGVMINEHKCMCIDFNPYLIVSYFDLNKEHFLFCWLGMFIFGLFSYFSSLTFPILLPISQFFGLVQRKCKIIFSGFYPFVFVLGLHRLFWFFQWVLV